MYRPYTSPLADSSSVSRCRVSAARTFTRFHHLIQHWKLRSGCRVVCHDGILMAPHYEAAYGQKPVERLLRQLGEAGYCDLRLETMRVEHSGDMAMETWAILRGCAQGGWNDRAGARKICESVAAAGCMVADCRLLEPDSGSSE